MSADVRLLHYSDIENVYDNPVRLGRLVGLLDRHRDEKTIVVGTGDNTGPCALSLATDGRQSLDFFRAVEPAFETFGNHDFDFGLGRTRQLVRASPQTWLSANVSYNGTGFARSDGADSTAVVDRNGTRIGLFGLTSPDTPSISPPARSLSVSDPIEAAAVAVDELRDQGVDYLVCLSHLGALDESLAQAVDVDLVLGGHDHHERVETVEGTTIAHPGVNGRIVNEVQFDSGDLTVVQRPVSTGSCNSRIEATFRNHLRDNGLDETIATVPEPIARSEHEVYRCETRVGNWIADAYRWVSGADIGLQNSGGIRSGPPLAGDVTVADCMNLVPFDEPLVVARLTGSELVSMFRDAVDGTGRWHAQVSGVTLRYDEATGQVSPTSVNGHPVHPDAEYTLATSKYLCQTDCEFPLLSPTHLSHEVKTQYEVLVEYARAHGINPAIENRVRTQGELA